MVPEELNPYLSHAIDLHRRLPVTAAYFEFYGYDSLFKASGGRQCDLEKLDAAGVRLFGIAVANGGASYFQIGPNEYEVAGPPEWALENLRSLFEKAMAEARSCPRVRVVATARDLAPDPWGGRIAVIPLVTCNAWMTDVSVLDEFFARGMRISHCAGSTCTRWCRAWPRGRVRGRVAPAFNRFGRRLVERMNELGIVIDLAHMSDESALAILEASSKPVIDGHTGSRDWVPWSRGLSDVVLRRIAEKGGAAGVHFADHLFTPRVWGAKYHFPDRRPAREPRLWAYNRHLLATVSDPNERARLRKDRAAQAAFYAERGLPPDPPLERAEERIATLADFADHVEHLVRVMGIEHVGLGGDVNGITDHSWPAGMDHVGELPHLTAELLRRGWCEDHIEKFLCGNWRRVFAECLPL